MYSDLLFYEGSDGVVDVYLTKNGSMDRQRYEIDWGINWTHLVNGTFFVTGNSISQLILYDAVSGTVRIKEIIVRTIYGGGEETLLHEIPNWRPGWSQIVVSSANNYILFYDAVQGVLEAYTLSPGSPWLTLQNRFANLSTNWKQIVPGNFGGPFGTDLLCYDAAAGVGEFYALSFTTVGSISLLNKISGWKTTFKQIVPGNFSGSDQTGLLCYDPAGLVGDFYSVDKGTIQLLEANTGWRSTWDLIVPGNFSDGKYTDLLFYDRNNGIGQFYRTNHGAIDQIALYTEFRHTWTHILAGLFATTPQTPPASVEATVIPSLQLFDPTNDSYLLQLTGFAFAPNEVVSLELTWQDQNQAPNAPIIQTTQADGFGGFVYQYSGSGGGVCIPFRKWTVVGIGQKSHRQSSSVSVGCAE